MNLRDLKNFTLMDQFDQQYFLYQKIHEYISLPNVETLLGMDSSRWRKAELLLKWLNKVSEEMVDIEELKHSFDVQVRSLGYCYELYQQHLTEENEQTKIEESADDRIINGSIFEMCYTPPIITLTKDEEYTLVINNERELFYSLTSRI